MAFLRVLRPSSSEERWVEVGQEPVTIGRGRANVLILRDDPLVSLRHAILERTSEGCCLCDAGSRNGTWVNGERVAERTLADGDQIQVGQTVLLFEERH